MRQAEIVQQHPKCLQADGSLPDLFMAVEFRSARGLRIVAVYDLYMIQSDRRVELLQGRVNSLFADDIVSGDVRVAGIDAGADGNVSAQVLDNLGNLLKASTEGEF